MGHIAALFLLFSLLFVSCYQLYDVYKNLRAKSEARKEFSAFRSWLLDHEDDSTFSEMKWRELLPLCRFADERMDMFDPILASRFSCEFLVQEILDDEEKPEDASV